MLIASLSGRWADKGLCNGEARCDPDGNRPKFSGRALSERDLHEFLKRLAMQEEVVGGL